MNCITDVIAAISTPPGKGGVAVIRVSGEGALSVCERCFRPASGKRVSDYAPRTAIYGYVTDRDGIRIDDVLLTYFPAPASYTGEDTVEISCHGGVLVTRSILELILSHGARCAEAGEFTRRAFLSGKLSLTEAEAIATVLEARSEAQIKLMAGPARERLAERISKIRAALVELLSSAYARIDYPDEDLGDFDDCEMRERLYNIKEDVSELISTYRTGRAISEGISTAIVGKPNVGKSSLYNLLVGEDRAIVTDIAGTTRDVLTSTVALGSTLLRLADTAGIRSGDSLDKVETIGIERSLRSMSECELLIAVFDLSREFDGEDDALLREIKGLSSAKIAVLNKSDLETRFDESKICELFDYTLKISTSDERGAVAELSRAVNELFTDEKIISSADAIVASARQHSALLSARESIEIALDALNAGYSQDAASSDIERALGAIAELDGRAVSEEIVADIFSKFCVGK